MLTVISLGWGVQSFTMAAMSALGELPPVDLAIHADTTWERSSTYEFAKRWTPWLETHGVKVVTVSDPQPRPELLSFKTDLPAYTAGANGDGRLKRQCTSDWKVYPMRAHITAVLRRRGLARRAGSVEQWIGISYDEWQRAKDSDVKYITHRFPLLEAEMDRAACIAWLERNWLEVPGKSACVFCPFHNKAAWEQMKRENGTDWQTAVEVDAAIRDKRPPYPLYVHRACKPLAEAVAIPEDFGYTQLDLLQVPDDMPCDSGYCFL